MLSHAWSWDGWRRGAGEFEFSLACRGWGGPGAGSLRRPIDPFPTILCQRKAAVTVHSLAGTESTDLAWRGRERRKEAATLSAFGLEDGGERASEGGKEGRGRQSIKEHSALFPLGGAKFHLYEY